MSFPLKNTGKRAMHSILTSTMRSALRPVLKKEIQQALRDRSRSGRCSANSDRKPLLLTLISWTALDKMKGRGVNFVKEKDRINSKKGPE